MKKYRPFAQVAALLLSVCCTVLLSSCGSGAVGAPPAPDPAAGTPLTITPSTAELLPNSPTTFRITGGTGNYSAFSSNSGVLPVTSTVTGSTFTVTANAVTADTSIDITVRDTANASAIAKVTVKFTGTPLTVTPATADLAPGVPTTFTITGGRAGYSAFSSNSGVLPIINASVTGSTFTVIPNAVTSDTTIDITVRDATNAAVTAKVTVKFIAGAPLTVSPSTADLIPGVSASFTITGGRAGYTVFSSNGSVLPVTTNVTGNTFTVTPNAVTADTSIDLTVRDALNAVVTAKVTVKFTGTALAINPATADLVPGLTTAFTITGGRPPYSAFSTNNSVLPVTTAVSGSTFSVTPNTVTADTPIDLTVRDALNASATAKVVVKFSGAPLAINPSTVTVFPDLPATFTISGGSGAYSAFSSNAAVLPVPTAVTGTSFTVVPNAVTADTAVDVTVRDEKGATATSKVTVKPSTLLNQITFTPLAPTGTGCGTNTVCSGGDAQFVVKAVQNGVILINRQIRFEVFQGAYQLVTPFTGALVNSLVVNTDSQGEAVIRITANVGAATQVATIQTTDVTSGLVRRYNFNIIQQVSGSGILSTLPSTAITITGAKGAPGADGSCPIGVTVDYYVYGGTPPYNVASPLTSVATVSPSIVSTRGGRFTATIKGCGTVAFIVTDATGRTVETAALTAVQGAKGDAVTTTALAVTPTTLTIACGSSGSVSVTGSGTFSTSAQGTNSAFSPPAPTGTGFSLSPSAGAIPNTVTFSASTGSVFSPILVDFTNGSLTQRVTVTVTGTDAARNCP